MNSRIIFFTLVLGGLMLHLRLAAQSDAVTLTHTPHIQYYHFNNDSVGYAKPRAFRFVTGVPATFAQSWKMTFNKKSILPASLIVASTLILLPFDQDIANGIHSFSKRINLNNERRYKTLFGFMLGSTKIKPYEMPQNLNSALYTMGEGSTSVFLTGGLFLYGKLKKDYRAGQAATDIMQAQLAVGVVTQLMKRVSGRESPFAASGPGGVWRPLTNPITYQHHVSQHDAFPSGHLASMMTTVTVLALHYPEKRWIRPVGYALMTLTSFAMINNDVHWASDYPMALGIGYLFGKATFVVNRALRHPPR